LKIQTLAELGSIDPILQRLTPWGLATGTRILTPEAAAEYHQRTVDVELAPHVLESTRKSFERLQQTHVAGILNYDLFTVAEGYSLLILEQAFAERFVNYYGGRIPLVNKTDETDYLENVIVFDQVFDALNKGGSHARGGWKILSLKKPGVGLEFSGNFRHLIDWARHEGLLHGQRFRRMEDFLVDVRNAVAHPTSYSRRANLDSAQSIRQVAEIINRIWGFRSPGGRVFPAPAKPEIVLPCWDPETGTISSNRGDDLAIWSERKSWRFIAILAFDRDESVWYFHSDFEATMLPAQYLWGPGSYQEALDWLATVEIEAEEVDYVDRHFVVHMPNEQNELPRNINQFAGLPEEARPGCWLLLKADFPTDALVHGRAIANKAEGHADSGFCKACSVEVVADGDWETVMNAAEQLRLEITPRPPRGIRVEVDRLRWL
jgi:hypothetical protein